MANSMETIEEYRAAQAYNPITAWLHRRRYAALKDVFSRFSQTFPTRIVEIGRGEAKAFGLLNQRFAIDYVGIEPARSFVDAARAAYGRHANFRIIEGRIEDHFEVIKEGSVVLALEVFEHIKERRVVRIIEQIAKAKPAAFICSVPVEIGPSLWIKNLGSFHGLHPAE
jgi:hypothetical protein